MRRFNWHPDTETFLGDCYHFLTGKMKNNIEEINYTIYHGTNKKN
jgi:hypothetical protein